MIRTARLAFRASTVYRQCASGTPVVSSTANSRRRTMEQVLEEHGGARTPPKPSSSRSRGSAEHMRLVAVFFSARSPRQATAPGRLDPSSVCLNAVFVCVLVFNLGLAAPALAAGATARAPRRGSERISRMHGTYTPPVLPAPVPPRSRSCVFRLLFCVVFRCLS
jgi:hypothetical protein